MEAPIQHQIPVGVQLDGVVPCCTTGTEICPAFHSPLTKYLAFPPKKKLITGRKLHEKICTIHLL